MEEAPRTCQIEVADQLDRRIAQQTARQIATSAGFSKAEAEEIVLAASELASNLVRHAGSGSLTFRVLESGGQRGLEIESQDAGPGILDVESSLGDGYSTAGGLGLGLGTVNRLMDGMEINTTPGLGTRIAATRWIRTAQAGSSHRWDVGAATRSRFYAAANGDAFVVKGWNEDLLVGLIDGLGHGAGAQEAALTAQRYILAHFDRPLDDIFAGSGRACRGTRGVVMALARFNSPNKLKFASFGNIESRTWCGDVRNQFTVQRGVVGADQRRVQVQEYSWKPGWLLALHSDGLRTSWQWEDIPGFQSEPAQVIAQRLLRNYGKEDDDATVVVVRS